MKKISIFSFLITWFFSHALAQTVIIGSGTGTNRYPLNYFNGYTRSAMIYTAAEMGNAATSKTIYSLAFNCANSGNTGPTKVYLKAIDGTMSAESPAMWSDKTAGLTAIYNGSPTAGSGWRTLQLATPFLLPAGKNLEVLVECNIGAAGITGSNAIYNSTTSSAAQFYAADNQPPAGNGTVSNLRPNILLDFTPPCAAPTSLANAPLATARDKTSIDGSFTSAISAPSGYIVVRSTAATLPQLVNGKTYSTGANTTLAVNGYIEYINSEAGSWRSGSLTPGTTYYYFIFSYNNSGCTGGPVYSTTAATTTATTVSCPVFSSIITIGGGGLLPGSRYRTLTDAIADLSVCGISSPVALQLNAGYDAALETFPIVLPAIPGASNTNTLTIRPAGGSRSISSNNTIATIQIKGGKYWIIDGRVGSTGSTPALLIANSNVAGGAAVLWQDDASYNTLTYTNLSAVYPSASAGVIMFGTGSASGNDYNTVSYCNIDGGAGQHASPTSAALVGVYSSGTSASIDNSGNTLLNNNIFNNYGPSSNAYGVYLTNSSVWTISGNRFYQTAIRSSLNTTVERGIYINTPAGGGYEIVNNTIGFSSPGGTGTTYFHGDFANRFIGIDLTASATASGIHGNTIAGISLITTSGAFLNDGIFSGIYVQSGTVNIGTVSGNVIGNGNSTGSISIATSKNGALINGISVATASTAIIQRNTVSSFGTAGSGNVGYRFAGIYVSGSGAATVSQNQVGSLTTPDAIRVGRNDTIVTTAPVMLAGIYLTNTGAQSISNNSISNLAAYSTGNASVLYGIYSSAASDASVLSNLVTNLVSTTGAAPETVSLTGIYTNNATFSQSISKNTISALRNINAAASGTITGIHIDSAALGGKIEQNKIFDLTSAGAASPSLYGINHMGGSWSLVNNMISLTNGSHSNAALLIGIRQHAPSPAVLTVYFNSVYIGGTATAGAVLSAGYANSNSVATSATLKNNIFVNARSGGTGDHYALVNANPLAPAGWNSDYNVFNTTGVQFAVWQTSHVSFAGWQSLSGGDTHSYVGTTGGEGAKVSFVNAPAGDLHVVPDNNCVLDEGGLPITGIGLDFDNETRSSLVADIGADEFTAVPFVFTVHNPASVCEGSTVDLTAPAITEGSATGVTLSYFTSADETTPLPAPQSVASSGTYYIKAVKGSCVSLQPVTVIIRALPLASLSASSLSSCEGVSEQVTITGTDGSSVSYTDGISVYPVVLSNGSYQFITPRNAGVYTYTITDVSLNGCAGIAGSTVSITTQPLPDASFSGPFAVALGANAGFSGTVTGGSWESNNAGSAPVNNAGIVHGESEGLAVISYTVTNPTTHCANTATAEIVIFNELTAPYFTKAGGEFKSPAIWKMKTLLGFVDATSAPAISNSIIIQHPVLLTDNFEVANGNSFAITDSDTSFGTLTINPNVTLSGFGVVDFGHKKVTVKSTALGAGAIGYMQSAIANADKVTVERYIPLTAVNSERTGRAWRLLTAPVTGTTIGEAWQEGRLYNNGVDAPNAAPAQFGTLITGYMQNNAANANSHGYDFWPEIYRGNSSIRYYDNATGKWQSFASINNLSLDSKPAYMLFVRGDRTVESPPAAGITTLRATGTLRQGAIQLPVDGNASSVLMGNPYASVIDFGRLYAQNAGVINNKFLFWNAKLSTYGAYTLVQGDGSGSYSILPSAFEAASAQTSARFIQSSQGFFVYPKTSGTIILNETVKNPQQVADANPFRENNISDKKLYVNLNLISGNGESTLADGLLARFDAIYSDATEKKATNVLKAANFNENLGIATADSTSLMVEARPEIAKTDTLQLKLWNVTKRGYQLQMKAERFDSLATLHAWLEDRYLGTKEEISLSGAVSSFSFAVTSDSLSWKADRFRIVFQNQGAVLPVTLTSLTATAKEGGVEVGWKVSNEVNMKGYTVEKSADGGRTSAVMAEQAAKNAAGAALTTYNSFDATPQKGDNLYRIRMTGKDGSVTYSQWVKVTIGEAKGSAEIVLYPNPVREGRAWLQLSQLAKGSYALAVYSAAGQRVYERKIVVGSGSVQTEEVKLGKTVAAGSYTLVLTNSNGEAVFQTKLMVND